MGGRPDERIAAALRDAESALSRRDYRAAHAHAMAVLARAAGHADALRVLALIAIEHGNAAKALEVLDRAARAAPDDPRVGVQRARCLLALGRPEEAARIARAVSTRAPDHAHTLDTLGVVLSRVGDHEAALPLYERAVARDPGVAAYRYNLGVTLQFLGRFDSARAHYERALALDPTHYRALVSLSGLRRATRDDNRIDALTALFERVESDADAALHVGHTIARELEDLGDWAGALDWLGRAKARKRAALRYDFDRDSRLFDAAIAASERLAPRIGAAVRRSAESAPILVVGMPRTGTTLVDRVLSSHPRVTSAGELADFARFVKLAARTPSPYVLDAETLDASVEVDLDDVAARYRAVLRTHARGADAVVDKMPLNVFFAAALLVALPDARVVCLRRHPMDACLSNYRQLFATHNHYYNYAFDLDDTARYYAGFDRLVKALRATLPPSRFLEVNYDAFVSDQVRETRRLIEFCDLEWDERCLDFHLNEAPVATASSVQVRAPLYRGASGRYRRYGTALERLERALRDAGIDVA